MLPHPRTQRDPLHVLPDAVWKTEPMAAGTYPDYRAGTHSRQDLRLHIEARGGPWLDRERRMEDLERDDSDRVPRVLRAPNLSIGPLTQPRQEPIPAIDMGALPNRRTDAILNEHRSS